MSPSTLTPISKLSSSPSLPPHPPSLLAAGAEGASRTCHQVVEEVERSGGGEAGSQTEPRCQHGQEVGEEEGRDGKVGEEDDHMVQTPAVEGLEEGLRREAVVLSPSS